MPQMSSSTRNTQLKPSRGSRGSATIRDAMTAARYVKESGRLHGSREKLRIVVASGDGRSKGVAPAHSGDIDSWS
jgi:hypothetical protein